MVATNPPIAGCVVVGSLKENTRQVLTFHPDGTISGLRVSSGKGVDVMEMGEASSVRVSDIVWNKEHQYWEVKFLAGPNRGTSMTFKQLALAHPDKSESIYAHLNENGVGEDMIVGFKTYELGVDAEIAYFNHERLSGSLTELDKEIL